MRLSTYGFSRDNNFNLIRISAALMVLITHSVALGLGDPSAEPLRATLGITLGTIAVDLFFVASGLLVCNSLMRSRSLLEFGWARSLRILPALIAMLLLVVIGLGTAITTLSPAAYLSSPLTFDYLKKCATLFFGVGYTLPGVFETNPYANAVNGSLWTLTYEVRIYALLAVAWAVAKVGRSHQELVFRALVGTSAVVSAAFYLSLHPHSADELPFLRLLYMFCTGAAFHVLRDRIPLSARFFWALLAGLFFTARFHRESFFFVYSLGIPYLLLYLAYVPGGAIRKYNRIGDYSYGVYIYAFPVQQTLVQLVPGIAVPALLFASVGVALTLAMLSWHLLERRALEQRSSCVAWTRRHFTDRGRRGNREGVTP